MTDPYRLTDSSPAATPADRGGKRVSTGQRVLRVVLWLLLIPAAGVNAFSGFTGQTMIGLAFGIVATACIVGLIFSYVMGRRK